MLVVLGGEATAAEGGYSNYIPGTYGDFAVAVPPDPGLIWRNDVYYYGADGGRAVLQGQAWVEVDVSIAMNLATLLYTTDLEILGGRYALGTLVPILRTDIEARASAASGSIGVQDDRAGIGDITLIPWALFWNFGKFNLSFAHYIIAPTGDYDTNRLANVGLNYWSFDTNVAGTYLDPERGYELSLNLGHIYNTENGDTDYQSGQEIHVDYMVNQYFSETFALGIHGFYLNQITGDRGSGAILGDFKAEAVGIGPALLWTPNIFGKDVPIIAKWLHEFYAENRLEGDHMFASFVIDF